MTTNTTDKTAIFIEGIGEHGRMLLATRNAVKNLPNKLSQGEKKEMLELLNLEFRRWCGWLIGQGKGRELGGFFDHDEMTLCVITYENLGKPDLEATQLFCNFVMMLWRRYAKIEGEGLAPRANF